MPLSCQSACSIPGLFPDPSEMKRAVVSRIPLHADTRILEKRNSLQMSQVFPFPYISNQMGLAFQGFYERDRRTGKVVGLPHQLYMHAPIKMPAAARCARGRARTFNP